MKGVLLRLESRLGGLWRWGTGNLCCKCTLISACCSRSAPTVRARTGPHQQVPCQCGFDTAGPLRLLHFFLSLDPFFFSRYSTRSASIFRFRNLNFLPLVIKGVLWRLESRFGGLWRWGTGNLCSINTLMSWWSRLPGLLRVPFPLCGFDIAGHSNFCLSFLSLSLLLLHSSSLYLRHVHFALSKIGQFSTLANSHEIDTNSRARS